MRFGRFGVGTRRAGFPQIGLPHAVLEIERKAASFRAMVALREAMDRGDARQIHESCGG